MIVGAPGNTLGAYLSPGNAYIFFGGVTGTKRADADADVILNGQSAADKFGRNILDQYNAPLAIGDFNGDGTSDVIVGAPEDDNNSTSRSGSAFVFFSSSVFPSVTFSDSTSSQSEDVTEVTIPVTLSKTSSSTVTVDFAVTSTATGGGVDFTLASGTLTFSAGTTTQNISFTIVDDLEVENTETITVTLSSPTSSIFVTSTISTHTFSITDDDSTIYITHAANTRDSSRLAISPYAQVIPNDSYTFIGISHPSLDTASTQIGLVIEAIGMTTTLNNRAGRAAVFTVDAGETHRVFIVNQSHPTINSVDTEFQTAIDEKVHLISTVDSAQFGSIRVTTLDPNANTAVVVNGKNTYKNLAQLSMWGVIYMESTGSGFAMEFVGDMTDSRIAGNLGELKAGSRGAAGSAGSQTMRPGAGIN